MWVIVALHAAIGAATGGMTRSRRAAVLFGPLLHVAGDRVPHRHPTHSAWEYVAGTVAIGLLVARRGVLDAATVGAAAAVLPDVEHVVPRLRVRGGKVLHRRPGADRRDSSGLSALTQTLLAAMIVLPLLDPERTPTVGLTRLEPIRSPGGPSDGGWPLRPA